MSLHDMVSIVSESCDRLAIDEVRDAILIVCAAEQERTPRHRLVASNGMISNCRRACRIHERAHGGDLLLGGLANMNSAFAHGQRMRLVAGRQALRPDGAAVECCKSDLADRVVGIAARPKRRHPLSNMNVSWSNMNVQSRMIGQVAGMGECGVMRLVRRLLTFGDQSIGGGTEAFESSRSRVRPGRFAFDRNSARRRRRVLPRAFTRAGMSIAGSRMFVQRRETRRMRDTGDLRMLRSGDNGLQTTVRAAVLPNYWANCLLIEQQLLALCVAEDGRAGAQWRPECPC